MVNNLLLLLLFIPIGLLPSKSQAEEPSTKAPLSFSSDVRPVLSNHCYACHGPDDQTRESDLRLDIAGDVDMDEVLDRIDSQDDDYVMPPPGHNKPLTQANKSLIEKWIDAGATYEKHWAFVLPKKSDVPTGSNPIDYFVDRKLANKGMNRSSRAEPAVLIRRLYLDLIGLPPSIQEADAFIAAPSQENYEAIVDQLLDSPRYGERWARKWLDLARYADTNGYEKDRDRNIWPYRDWVIKSINQGMPFDQFTIQQLAGDMLPDATQSQLIATGFHRNTMLNEEGGIDPLEFRYHAMTDRVATTGTTWLGLTTGCAQCHTHKFDPITHEDYFGMMAYMNNTEEPELYLTDETTENNRSRNLKQAEALIAELKSKWPQSTDEKKQRDFESAFTNWWETQKSNIFQWRTIIPDSMSTNAPHLIQESDGVIFAFGDTTKLDTYTLNFPATDQPIRCLRLEVLPDKRLPGGGPGLTYFEGKKGDFFLAEIDVTMGDSQTLAWQGATETFAANGFGDTGAAAAHSIDGEIQSGWAIDGRSGFRHVAVFNLKDPLPAGEPFTLTMKFGRHFPSALGKFRLSVVDSQTPPIATLLRSKDVDENEAKRIFLMHAEEVSEHADKIRALLNPLYGNSTLVMQERQPGFKRKTFLHHRGEYTQPDHEVQPRLPDAIFDSTERQLPADRLEFAQWLVSADNPLTARVIANRQWASFFGVGLVKTVADFGMQGESPSHPELLDFLALQLLNDGWSVKSIHRLITTSETYQQSSKFTDANPAADRLLQRFPRKRLEAEIIRDASLAAADLLVEKMYGPPVRPPQPSGVAANYKKSKWKASEGPDRYRRSIYTYQKRTAPFAMFTTFDASSGEACLARRDASNTPLQALTLMNDPMFIEISDALGKRMESVQGSTQDRIVAGFRWLVTRPPSEDEAELLTAFYKKHNDWAALARVLLCLDETITKN